MKFFAIIFSAMICSLSATAQGDWSSLSERTAQSTSATGDQKPFGLLIGLDGGFLGRSESPTMSDGDFHAGMLFGRKELQLAMVAGVYGQSEVVQVNPDGNVYWDPVCGCQVQTPVRDWSNRLRGSYFQAGFAYASPGTAVMITAGVAELTRRVPTWLPFNDSLEVLELVQQPRETVLSASLSGLFKSGSDLVIVEGQGFLSSDIYGRARASYLLGLDEGQFYGGPTIGLNSNMVTGYEALLGPQLLISGSSDDSMNVFQADLSGGVSYNEVHGIGFWVNFAVSVSRLNKSIFP